MKNLFITLGLAMTLGAGVVAGVAMARGNAREVKAIDEDSTCVARGTLASVGLSGDWATGVSIGTWNGSNQFEAFNVLLETTDEFKFVVDGAWLGHGQLGGGAYSKFENIDNLKVNTRGYYNFYIQASNVYAEYVPTEDVEDGYYLRGSKLGWTGAPLALSGTGPYTVTRVFEADEKIQMVHYVDGLASYVPAVTVTPADTNYFNAWKVGNDAQVEKDGTYTVSITAAGAYTFTDSASKWCREFLDSMTCTNSGTVAPVFKTGYSWTTTSASYATSYNALDDIAKDAIHDADAVADGSVIQEAVSRYDTIVANHKFVKFIDDRNDNLRAPYIVPSIFNNETNNVSWIIAVIGVASLVAVGGVFFIRKRREHN